MEQGFSWKAIVVGKPYEGVDSWECRDPPNPFLVSVLGFGLKVTS